MEEIERLEKKIGRIDRADEVVNWIVRIILVLILALVISFLYDTYAPDDHAVTYHDGDTWIVMEGTHIDYPIMQGADNFEYLDKDPNGEFYAGGSIFLDYRNQYDFSDQYNVIYGHNMAGGKMFSDLKKYYDQRFFEEHTEGMLFTPDQNYHLQVIGILKTSAYGPGVYGFTQVTGDLLGSIAQCRPIRQIEDNLSKQKIIALSTCSTSMNDQRDVVFCIATPTDVEYADFPAADQAE